MYSRFTLHVPAQFNDGGLVPSAVLDELESELLRIGGGYTLTNGFGAWRGESEEYREPVRLYHVDIPASDRDASWRALVSLGQRVAVTLKQEAVYFTESPINAAILGQPNLGGPARPLGVREQ